MTYLKNVKQLIPELTIVQAAVDMDDKSLKDALDILEWRLEAQRSKASTPHGMGLMISERARRTGKPGVEKDRDVQADENATQKFLLDRSQVVKRTYLKRTSLTDKIDPNGVVEFPEDISRIAKKGDWLAVVHADGNSLGRVVQGLFQEIGDNDTLVQQKISRFSSKLNTATQQAVRAAFDKVVRPKMKGKIAPVRPILLGGDDLSLLIRGDLALDFTYEYLRAFEQKTKEQFKELNLPSLKNGLTACAGIAYIKPNYPIHYGMDLAESLGKYSKDIAKSLITADELAPSCLSFHKVQSSFVEEFNVVVKRELTAQQESIHFNYGPYFVSDLEKNPAHYPTVQQLNDWVQIIQRGDAPKSNLRNWLAELHRSEEAARQLMNRIISRNRRYERDLNLSEEQLFKARKYEREEKQFTHIHDVLTIASFTKND